MCGINGFNFNDKDLILKMIDATHHRGPDQEGYCLYDEMSIGHTRLSIIDLSENGKQPMYSEDKSLSIVFNGEIYNYIKLREILKNKGHSFRTKTDTEVILKAFMEYGEDCVNHFNGIFAFAIYDRNDNSLFLARDHIGVKPLYFFWDGKKFIFSSEIKAILCHEITRKVNKHALPLYFDMNYIPAPHTIWENIYKLPAASTLKLKNNTLSQRKYWQLSEGSMIHSKTEIKTEILDLFKDSVKGQMISDRPIGIFLSGGIDSTAMLAVASQFSNGKITTFSSGYGGTNIQKKYNVDLDIAKQVSKYFDTDHHELIITGKMALANLERVIFQMDEPNSNPTQISTYLLSEFAKKKVAVSLTGDGGDEIFGGYEHYYSIRRLRYLSYMPEILHPMITNYINKNSISTLSDLKSPTDRYLHFWKNSQSELKKILNPCILNTNMTNNFFYNQNLFEHNIKDSENEVMRADIKTWLVDESLMRADKMSMAFGLELRLPFLDYKLVEFAQKIPSKFKLRNKTQGKSIFIQAIRDIIPSYVLDKPKHGWVSPAAKWISSDLKEFFYDTLSYANLDREVFNPEEVMKMLDDHVSGKKYNLTLLWAIMTYQVWKKTNKV